MRGGKVGHPVMLKDFDVAVTSTKESGESGLAGIRVLEFFNASGQIENSASNQSISRVKFRVPLRLPATKLEA